MAPKLTTARPAADDLAGDGDPRRALASQTINVVVLVEDATLFESLKAALDPRQRIWRADDALHAIDLLLAAQTGVFFVDAGLTGRETAAFVDRLQLQFPELPIVVTGRREDELELGQRISSGAVFRFLHKPVSAERIRNFIDAAARRAGEQPRPAAKDPDAEIVDSTPSIRLPRLSPKFPAFLARAAGSAGFLLLVALGAAAIVALIQQRPWERLELPALTATAPAKQPVTAAPAPQQRPDLERLLGAAGIALSQGHLSEPSQNNAIELYRAVLERDPGNAMALAGLAAAADELLRRVEQQLLAEDLDGAASALDAARSAEPSNPRLDFLSTQLQHERDRLARAAGQAPARRDATAARAQAQQLASLLNLADERMKQGRLTGDADAADAYVAEARALEPRNAGVQQALNALSWRMMLAASEAIDSGDAAAAGGWLDRAEALGVDERGVARLRTELASAQRATAQQDMARLLTLANQRIAQGNLLAPAGDSARHYIDLLRAASPEHPGLAETRALFAERLLDAAGRQAREGRYAESDRLLAAASDAGATASGLSDVRYQLAASKARAAAVREVLPESALTRSVHAPVEYPTRARARGIEGWVEVEFTVAADGSTSDPVIKGSSPANVFDAAVINAIGGWRYEPRVVGGQPVDQRVQTRVRFQLSGN